MIACCGLDRTKKKKKKKKTNSNRELKSPHNILHYLLTNGLDKNKKILYNNIRYK